MGKSHPGAGVTCGHVCTLFSSVPVPCPAATTFVNPPSPVLTSGRNLPSACHHTREGLVQVELGLTNATMVPAKHQCPLSQTNSGSAVLWAG